MEAEYTITSPETSSTSATQSSASSYSASGWRPRLTRLSIDEPPHRRLKHLAAVPVIAKHVEARARGRKKHAISRLRLGESRGNRLFHARRKAQRNTRALERGCDLRRVAADQHHGARAVRDDPPQRRRNLGLVPPPPPHLTPPHF